LTKNTGDLTIATTGSQTGELNLAAGSFFSFSAGNITYTNTTINGDGGLNAAQHATNLGGGAGPFLINGQPAGVPPAPPMPPDANTAAGISDVNDIVNNAVNANSNTSLYSGSAGQASDSIGNLAFAPLPASGGYITSLSDDGSYTDDDEPPPFELDDDERRLRRGR
jgi:hypothetical protein